MEQKKHNGQKSVAHGSFSKLENFAKINSSLQCNVWIVKKVKWYSQQPSNKIYRVS